MLTSILAVYTSYSDKTSCATDSLISISTEPLNTCTANYDDDGYYKNICSNGLMQIVEYTNANCTTISSVTPQPTGCQDGTKVKCNAEPTPLSYVIQNTYSTSGCTSTAAYTFAYVQGACNDNSYTQNNIKTIESAIYTCINTTVYRYSYAGSATCTGTTSQVYKQPAICTR